MAAKAAPKHSKGHIEFIGEHEFYEVDGQLFDKDRPAHR